MTLKSKFVRKDLFITMYRIFPSYDLLLYVKIPVQFGYLLFTKKIYSDVCQKWRLRAGWHFMFGAGWY